MQTIPEKNSPHLYISTLTVPAGVYFWSDFSGAGKGFCFSYPQIKLILKPESLQKFQTRCLSATQYFPETPNKNQDGDEYFDEAYESLRMLVGRSLFLANLRVPDYVLQASYQTYPEFFQACTPFCPDLNINKLQEIYQHLADYQGYFADCQITPTVFACLMALTSK